MRSNNRDNWHLATMASFGVFRHFIDMQFDTFVDSVTIDIVKVINNLAGVAKATFGRSGQIGL